MRAVHAFPWRPKPNDKNRDESEAAKTKQEICELHQNGAILMLNNGEHLKRFKLYRRSKGRHQGVEVFQPGILNHHATTAVLVLDAHFQAKLTLQAFLRLADVRIERFFCLFLRSFLRFRSGSIRP